MTEGSYGRTFWVALVVGWAIIGFGVLSLLQRTGATRPLNFAIFFLGAIGIHDFVVTPAVLAFGWLVGSRLPRASRGVLLGALIVTGMVALASVPVVLRFGRLTANPSLLPRNGALGLLLVMAIVWSVTVVLIVRAERRTRVIGREERDDT